MTLSDFSFPMLGFNQGIVDVHRDEDSVTTCTTGGLKGGWYDNLLLVDSLGKAIRVKRARKLHGIGRFWGYNIFLSRTLKVELIFEGEPFQLSLPGVKERVLSGLGTYGRAVDPGYWTELERSIEDAKTIADIIQLIPE